MNAGNPIQSAVAMEIVSDKYKGLANSVNQMVFNLGWATMGPFQQDLSSHTVHIGAMPMHLRLQESFILFPRLTISSYLAEESWRGNKSKGHA